MKVTLGIKTQQKVQFEGVVGFLREKFEQNREFRSEDLQEENNEMESRKRQYNQIIIQNQQMQVQQSQANQALQQQQGQILAFLLQKGFVSEIVFNLFLQFTRKLCFIKFCSTSLAIYRSSRSQMLFKMASKQVFLKVLQTSQEKNCVGVSF